jgi:hypothetical protein
MNRVHASTNTRRKIAAALLVALAALGGTVYAQGGKPDFSIAPSPSSQTVDSGKATAYSVTVTRANGFTGAVSFSVSGLPSGASAGFSPATVSASSNSTTLTVQTSSATAAGSYSLTIVAVSGNLSHSASVALTMQAPSTPDFTLAAQPASQNVVQSDKVGYTVQVNRAGGFGGPVSLGVSGLPDKWTASWSANPAAGGASTLTVQTQGNTQTGTYSLTLTGSATIGGKSVLRSATVVLVVQKNQGFQIAGSLPTKLTPGGQAPLDLTLTNPYSFSLQVASLAASVQESTSSVACSGTRNFSVVQFSGSYPLTLPPGTWRLSQLVADSAKWPQVRMIETGANQDACKSTTIALAYSGAAGR